MTVTSYKIQVGTPARVTHVDVVTRYWCSGPEAQVRWSLKCANFYGAMRMLMMKPLFSFNGLLFAEIKTLCHIVRKLKNKGKDDPENMHTTDAFWEKVLRLLLMLIFQNKILNSGYENNYPNNFIKLVKTKSWNSEKIYDVQGVREKAPQ